MKHLLILIPALTLSASAFATDLMTCKLASGGSFTVTADDNAQKTSSLVLDEKAASVFKAPASDFKELPTEIEYAAIGSGPKDLPADRRAHSFETGGWVTDSSGCSLLINFDIDQATKKLFSASPIALDAKETSSLECGKAKINVGSCTAGDGLIQVNELLKKFRSVIED